MNENYKIYYKSKRFWGLVASLAGFAVTVIAKFFGHDVGQYIDVLGNILLTFGIPFTAYGAAVAQQPLGFKDETYGK